MDERLKPKLSEVLTSFYGLYRYVNRTWAYKNQENIEEHWKNLRNLLILNGSEAYVIGFGAGQLLEKLL